MEHRLLKVCICDVGKFCSSPNVPCTILQSMWFDLRDECSGCFAAHCRWWQCQSPGISQCGCWQTRILSSLLRDNRHWRMPSRKENPNVWGWVLTSVCLYMCGYRTSVFWFLFPSPCIYMPLLHVISFCPFHSIVCILSLPTFAILLVHYSTASLGRCLPPHWSSSGGGCILLKGNPFFTSSLSACSQRSSDC